MMRLKISIPTSLCMFLIFLLHSGVYAQDTIIKLDKSEIKAEILEIDDVKVRFQNLDLPDSPMRELRLYEIIKIIYSNGKIDEFDKNVGTDSKSQSVVLTDTVSQPKFSDTRDSAKEVAGNAKEEEKVKASDEVRIAGFCEDGGNRLVTETSNVNTGQRSTTVFLKD